MKKVILIIVLFIVALGIIMIGTNAYGEENVVVKVGYVNYYNVIQNINSIDRKGYGYDVLNLVDNYTNHSYEFIEGTYAENIERLNNGEIDIFIPLTKTEERENQYYFGEEVFAIEQILVCVDEKFETLYDDEETMNGKNIFTVTYSGYLQSFEEFLKRKNISMEYIFNDEETIEPVIGDYYLTSSLNYIEGLKTTAVVGMIDSYVMSTNENSYIVTEIDEALKKIKEKDPLVLYSMHDKYYEDTILAQRDFEIEQLNFNSVSDNNTVEIAVNINQRPISYINDEGNLDGIAIKLIEDFAITYDFNILYFMYDTSKNTNEEIREIYSQSDIVLSQTEDTEFKNEYFGVTDPYSSISFVTLKVEDTIISENELDSKIGKLGILNYDTFDEEEIQKYFNQFEIEIYTDMFEVIEKYNNGELQGIIATQAEANALLELITVKDTQVYTTSLELPIRFFINTQLGENYISVYNIMIERIDEAYIKQLEFDQIEGFQISMTFSKFIQEYIVEIILMIIIVLLIIAVIVIYIRNKRKKRLIEATSIDKLTGLDSLAIFYQKMEKLLKNAKENEYIIVTIDIDSLKIIKDTFGAEKVSNIIRSVAIQLKEKYQDESLVCRIENDVFILVIKNEQTELERTIKELAIVYVSGIRLELPKTYNISLSIGGYIVSNPTEQITKMIDFSTIARMEGKKSYKNTFNIFDRKMKKKYEIENNIVSTMKQAMEDREFVVVYQPKVNLKTMKMASAEALVRWIAKGEKMIYPDQFIPVFERNGFITDLDYYVFEEVCRVLDVNRNLDMPIIAVNISGITLIDDMTPLRMIEILNKYNLKTSDIQIEITESAFVKEKEMIREKFDKLKELGFSVAIDDFGAGISSLNRLNDLKADVIKIDKGFLDNQEERANIIIESIIKMANRLKIKVVTEGVETKEQAELLKKLGCNEAQGYYFDKPLPQETFLENIQNDKKYEI